MERLEEIAKILGASPKNKICKAMQGLIQEGDDTIKEEAEASIKDFALITAAQKVEHYEISCYN